MGRSRAPGREGSGRTTAVQTPAAASASGRVRAHRARLRGAGVAPGVSRGAPWGLPESPPSEEQGLRPTGTSRESRATEAWGMKTPRHRLRHDVAVLTSKLPLGPQFVLLENKLPPRTPPPLWAPRVLAHPPGVTLGLNTTLPASLTTDRTSPLPANDAGDGAPEPSVRRPHLLHSDLERVAPSQDFWETCLPPGDVAFLPLP